MQKIDIFNHIFPESFHTLMMKVAGDHKDIGKRVRGIPMLTDLDQRFRVMDRFGDDYRQILSLASPPLDPERGPMYIRETIKIIDGLDLSEADRNRIYRGNAVKLLKLKES